jgi:hypothetical protein
MTKKKPGAPRGRPPVPIERDPQRFQIACIWAFLGFGLGRDGRWFPRGRFGRRLSGRGDRRRVSGRQYWEWFSWCCDRSRFPRRHRWRRLPRRRDRRLPRGCGSRSLRSRRDRRPRLPRPSGRQRRSRCGFPWRPGLGWLGIAARRSRVRLGLLRLSLLLIVLFGSVRRLGRLYLGQHLLLRRLANLSSFQPPAWCPRRRSLQPGIAAIVANASRSRPPRLRTARCPDACGASAGYR